MQMHMQCLKQREASAAESTGLRGTDDQNEGAADAEWLTYRDVEGLADLLGGFACSNPQTPSLHTEDTCFWDHPMCVICLVQHEACCKQSVLQADGSSKKQEYLPLIILATVRQPRSSRDLMFK